MHLQGEPSIAIQGLTHRYGEKAALSDLSLEIPQRSIFGVLGPNGSGKSTLFRLLSTLVPVQSGTIRMLGYDVAKDQQAIRERIGVVFQSPSLDRKLTARENILFQAALYGIGQREAKSRLDELSEALGVKDQLGIKVDKLSGGLRRRVELVKGLLHRPELLLLDEPSTGLDPLSRLELWQSLEELRLEHSTTIVLTTHLLEEAEKCDRIAILDQGRLLVDESPEALRKSTGQIVFSVATNEPSRVVEQLEKQYGYHGSIHGGSVRIVRQQTDISPMDVYASLGSLVTSMTIGPPSLEDVFLRIAGKSFS